ncbi:(2,3-dihydroxybenzoyl)adenylate synthase [Streptomyces venezuelae]|uniref:(2,3-dihydroxybenzoyl)adenylate synthase n=1 Tax=Streptomyces venezuelae TaxID=54571 RepID=UPI001F3154F7|nr:AMP-binding protein [Streptomyces venezuelae]
MQEGCVPWPESAVRTYREEGYWTTEVLGVWPAARAPEARARTALVTRAGVLTHEEVDRAADRMAAGLLGAGLAPGDRVVVQLLDEAELVVLSLALFRTGILPVYALPAHRSAEITHLVSTAGAAAYVCPERVLDCDFRLLAQEVLDRTDSLRQVFVAGDPGPFTALSSVDAEPVALPAPDPEDVALFLLSGGTSGPPKLIPRTHADYAYQLRETARLCGVGPDSVYLAALPVEHNFALGCPGVLGTLRAGGTAVIAPAPTADACFPLIERARVTITSLVPPLVPLWLDAAEWTDHDLSSLEVLQVGGARLDPDTARQVPKALGCTLQQVYGMAEGLLNFTRLDDPEDVIVHTQGRPLSPADDLEVTVLGRRHEVVGRINDVVNRGGEKVPTLEVEEHLLAAFPLLGAAVIALPDALMGERTCACVVPRDRANPPTLREVKAAFRGRGVAAYKVPDQLVVLERLPMTGVGKVDKRALLAQLET